MTRRYLITLVGTEEPNGCRTITTKADDLSFPVLFAVGPETLRAYTPNAGDTLVRDVGGNIRFERQD